MAMAMYGARSDVKPGTPQKNKAERTDSGKHGCAYFSNLGTQALGR